MASMTEKPDENRDVQERGKIRNRLIGVVSLFVIIILLFVFLLNYSGLHDWSQPESNLTVFVAVSVNIVLLTAIFYLILRNLFKLVYERKKPIGGVGLKTKLIVAFVALSLPSTAFHLMASGFMAFLFETWSKGEHNKALKSTRVVVESLAQREDQLLRRQAEDLLGYLPREARAYRRGDWLSGYRPRHQGGVFIYGPDQKLLARWVSSPEIAGMWQPPPADYFANKGEFYWNERTEKRTLKRLLLPVPDSHPPLKAEVVEITPPDLSKAIDALTREQAGKVFLGRDLLVLVLSILVVMTLFIIFAATWMAFYLARGFVTPVERLAEATERVSQGDLGFQVGHGSLGPLEGDFASLVDSFNMMSRQLKEQRRQLVKSSEELRSSHEQLSERNRLVELLLENIDAGIISLDRDGRVNAINRAALKLLPPLSQPWQGRGYRIVLPPELAQMLEEAPERLRDKPSRAHRQVFTFVVNSRPTLVEVSAHALETPQGETEGVVLMLKDVTSLQRTQRALAWREVARRVAHEIKNPLQPIQTSAERIRRRYLERVNGEGEILDQCTRTIIDTVASLKNMVNEFSQFAKLPESRPVADDLNAVLRELARFYENGLPDHVRLRLDLQEDLPRFPLDREQIKRAVTNLIDNAAASIPEDATGLIVIATRYDSRARQVTCEVSDNGTGVPKHIQNRLFEPYTSTKAGGTGLGLTIVNQIVSDHNGFIRFSEIKPHGSQFTMEFPVGEHAARFGR
jgi:two-component system nitrogen regulation sensor histidine kinase NtrY